MPKHKTQHRNYKHLRRTITDVMVQFDMLLPHNNNNEQYFHQSHLSTFFYDDEQTIKLAPTKEGASKKQR